MNKLLDDYLTKEEQEEFLNIVKPIIDSDEFKERMSNKFPHHGKITLGEHILEVAILTYKKCKKKRNVNLKTAVYIAMMHDLYSLPWQNNDDARVNHFFNKHGFRHPLEAAINSIKWYPEIYENNDSKIIIDGIIHHMFPLPVRTYELKEELLELKNNIDIDIKYKNMILESSKRYKLFNISLCRSKYKEGKIVSRCDKKVSLKQIKNIHNLTSLVTGHNKNLK